MIQIKQIRYETDYTDKNKAQITQIGHFTGYTDKDRYRLYS